MKIRKYERKIQDKEIIKFVRKANMWCKIIFKNNKQTQEWYSDKELTKKINEL